jgi:hypothetical protein
MLKFFFEPSENIIKDEYSDIYDNWKPIISICKTSNNYAPVFCAKHNLFFNFLELEMFYEEYKDYFVIKDSQDREYDFENFKEKIELLKEYSKHKNLFLRQDEYGCYWED